MMLEKKGRRRLENTEEIITELIKFFPDVNVGSVSSSELEQMPIKQQVIP